MVAGVFNIGDDDRALRRLLVVAMALGFLALIGAGIAALTSSERAARYNASVDHTYRAITMIGSMQVTLEQSETARRGFMLSGEELFETGYRTTTARLMPEFDAIAQATADNPKQAANAAKARRNLIRIAAVRDRSMARVKAGEISAAFVDFQEDRSVELIRAIRARLRAMVAEEERLLVRRTNEQRASAALLLWILTSAGVLVVLVGAVSLVTVLRYTRDLGASRDRLIALNDSLEEVVAERTAGLSRANEEIQRFAYIVSHDLRAPLVNVMGFTAELEAGQRALSELVDRAEADAPAILTVEASEAARADLPEAIGFIRTSTAKMDRLINAILKLSREGRRVISPEPLDMAALMTSIRDTLQHRLDATGTELTIHTPLPAIVSDRLAIEQVFANVVENAVKYLDPARPGRIAISGRVVGDRAIFSIEDNGRGIAASDHQRIFDLFRRSGVQNQPGEGIGLAHVRALTYRLGGTIDVASELGRGTTFNLRLPVTYSEISGVDR